MGLTGSGGALIAIPLFLQFLGMGLKQATVYSLVAVVFASLLNFLGQRRFADKRLGGWLFLSSVAGSFASAPFKKNMPDSIVIILLILVSGYALYSTWFSFKKSAQQVAHVPLFVTLLLGFVFGALTTFTGLGGGVLLVPVFLNFYGIKQSYAVGTSLFAVSLSSISSLLIQIWQGLHLDFNQGFIFLLFGIGLAAFSIKWLIVKLPQDFLHLFRKIFFSLVVIFAMARIIQA